MLVRFLPIPRHEAIPSLGSRRFFRNWLDPGWGHVVPTFLPFQDVAFQRVSTEQSDGKEYMSRLGCVYPAR
jgi:hypothetical protein